MIGALIGAATGVLIGQAVWYYMARVMSRRRINRMVKEHVEQMEKYRRYNNNDQIG